jgi:hypothetical protein
MADIFISYSRKDSSLALAEKLHMHDVSNSAKRIENMKQLHVRFFITKAQ